MIYGTAKCEPGEEFKMIFEQTIKNEKTVVISRLMEQRTNITNQCYAGDIPFYLKKEKSIVPRSVDPREKFLSGARIGKY